MKAWTILRAAGMFCLLLPSTLVAQFSPGELSRSHAHLEGTGQCTRCHDVGREITGSRCLTCHTEIGAELQRPIGFHAAAVRTQKCVECHREHLGRDVVPAPDPADRFDHAATGFPLEGKHASATCTDCHSRANIPRDRVMSRTKASGRITYLGLRPDCSACHQDPHEAGVGTACVSCHDAAAWAPARRFDHAGTEYRLTGRHRDVPCTGCHTALHALPGTVRFTTQAYGDCTPCHASPHRTLAASGTCVTCHTTEAWNRIARKEFDHRRTGFVLKGRHVTLACARCHGSDRERSLPGGKIARRNACSDCHEDVHRAGAGMLARGECSACHTESGFRPSTFTLAAHASSRFALSGAHIATPCSRCHSPGPGLPVLRFETHACTQCHKDPHRGLFTAAGGGGGCAACHSTSRWDGAAIDHAGFGFPLAGKHARTPCAGCHGEDTLPGAARRYRGTPKDCRQCHRDVHEGQFAAAGATDCSGCHRPAGWTDLVFDHATGSRFQLTGGHAGVACASCHRPERSGGKNFIRYKPIAVGCASCHAGKAGVHE